MPKFAAHVEFHFEAEDLRAGGRRLIELSKAADRVGFDMKRGQIEPAPLDIDADEDDGTGYGPRID